MNRNNVYLYEDITGQEELEEALISFCEMLESEQSRSAGDIIRAMAFAAQYLALRGEKPEDLTACWSILKEASEEVLFARNDFKKNV